MSDVSGPIDINTRYILEDVPFGLVPTLLLAELACVRAPLHQAGVDILSACYGRDFAADNDLLNDMGWPDVTALRKIAVEGHELHNR